LFRDFVIFANQPTLLMVGVLISVAILMLTVFGFLVAGSRSEKGRKIMRLGGILFVFCLLPLLTARFMAEWQSWREIQPMLRSANIAVRVDGAPLRHQPEFVEALRRMPSFLIGHHSHPLDRGYLADFQTSVGAFQLEIFPDSDEPHEFWVYYPNLLADPIGVGHVFTDAFDGVPAKLEKRTGTI
jgi:hypothetical protein